MKRSTILFASLAFVVATHLLYPANGYPADFLNSGKALPKNLPFSEAVRHGNTLYLSGQVGIVPGSLKLAPGGIREDAKQTMENIKTSLEAHGYTMAHLIKCTVMLTDMSEWPVFNEVYKTFLPATIRPVARLAPMVSCWARVLRSNVSRLPIKCRVGATSAAPFKTAC